MENQTDLLRFSPIIIINNITSLDYLINLYCMIDTTGNLILQDWLHTRSIQVYNYPWTLCTACICNIKNHTHSMSLSRLINPLCCISSTSGLLIFLTFCLSSCFSGSFQNKLSVNRDEFWQNTHKFLALIKL